MKTWNDQPATNRNQLKTRNRSDIPSSKQTWQWKIPIFNMEYIFNRSIFHCHVSLPEGMQFNIDNPYHEVAELESLTMAKHLRYKPDLLYDQIQNSRNGRWTYSLEKGQSAKNSDWLRSMSRYSKEIMILKNVLFKTISFQKRLVQNSSTSSKARVDCGIIFLLQLWQKRCGPLHGVQAETRPRGVPLPGTVNTRHVNTFLVNSIKQKYKVDTQTSTCFFTGHHFQRWVDTEY